MNISNGVKITIESSGESYHSLTDWGLALSNTDVIGELVQETNYVTIPGASIDLDLSEAMTGKPVFKSRTIKMEFGGLNDSLNWDAVISDMRNKIDGRICQLCFDNDKAFYWRGRVHISDFTRTRTLGKFTLSLDHADPYKYDVFASNEKWEWDPFDFEQSTITYIEKIYIDSSNNIEPSITIPTGHMESTPIFIYSTDKSATETVTTYVKIGDVEHTLDIGENEFAEWSVGGDSEVTASFRGYGYVEIEYRGGSL